MSEIHHCIALLDESLPPSPADIHRCVEDDADSDRLPAHCGGQNQYQGRGAVPKDSSQNHPAGEVAG